MYRKMFIAAVAALAVTPVLTSCGDEKETVEEEITEAQIVPMIVFTSGVPVKVGDLNITIDQTARVSNMSDNSNEITFTYLSGNASGHGHYDMSMTVKSHGGATTQCYFTINEDLIASHCTEVGPSGTKEWDFVYNNQDRLEQIKVSGHADWNVANFTYYMQSIGKVAYGNEGDDTPNTITISNALSKTNKGCIMLFADNYGLDIGNMHYAYYAGLLGRASVNLPAKRVFLSADKSTTDTHEYEWELKSDKMPARCTVTDYNQDGTTRGQRTIEIDW